MQSKERKNNGLYNPRLKKPELNPNTQKEKFTKQINRLTTEPVEGASLALKGVDNIEGSDSLPLSVLSVGNSVADDTFQEGLENTTSLLVNHCEE